MAVAVAVAQIVVGAGAAGQGVGGAHPGCQTEGAEVLRQNFANTSGNVMGMRQLERKQQQLEKKQMQRKRVQQQEVM